MQNFFLNENAKATWIMITPLVTSNSYLYIAPRLNSLIQRFYSRHHKLVDVTKFPFLKWQYDDLCFMLILYIYYFYSLNLTYIKYKYAKYSVDQICLLRMCLGCSVLFRALYCFQSKSSTPCQNLGQIKVRKMYYIDCFCFNFTVFYICIESGDHILSNYRHKMSEVERTDIQSGTRDSSDFFV